MKTILVCNQKGGTGKTLTTLALAYNLSDAGKKVMIVDADKQANTSMSLIDDVNLEEYEDYNLYNVIMLGESLEENALQLNDNLFLVQASPRLAKLGDVNINELTKAIKKIESYDFIIIDSGPQIDRINLLAIAAAELYVIPVLADKYGTKAIKDMLATIGAVKESRKFDYIVLPNMYDARINRRVEYYQEIKNTYAEHTIKPVPVRASILEIAENEEERKKKREQPLRHFKNLTYAVLEKSDEVKINE